MLAKKANKVYRIDEARKAAYLKDGYDICDEKGNVIEHSPISTVPYTKHAQVLKENEALKAELEELKKENEALKAATAEKPAKNSSK